MEITRVRKTAIMMAQGAAQRVSPGTWFRTKAVWPMVGTPMAIRILADVFKPQQFDEVSITTAIFKDQISRCLKDNAAMISGLKVSCCEGEESDRFLKQTNTAHGALNAFRMMHEINSFGEITRFTSSTALQDLISLKATLGKKKQKYWTPDEKEDLKAKIHLVGEDVGTRLKPLSFRDGRFSPFAVTGCDALTTGDLGELFQHFRGKLEGEELSHKDSLGALKIKRFGPDAIEQVKNYGVVRVGGKRGDDPEIIYGFEEKSSEPHKHTEHDQTGKPHLSYLVNPQLYMFDPSVLAIVELFAKYGEPHRISPDWGGDILPILAASGKLLWKGMGEGEYWNDVGDYGTWLETSQDILNGRAGAIPILAERRDCGWIADQSSLVGEPEIIKPVYVGAGAIIKTHARLENSVVENGAEIEGRVSGSYVFENAHIPRGATVVNSIIGKDVVLPDNVEINLDGQVVETVYDGAGQPIILSAPIPYEEETHNPVNRAPDMPKRVFLPNK